MPDLVGLGETPESAFPQPQPMIPLRETSQTTAPSFSLRSARLAEWSRGSLGPVKCVIRVLLLRRWESNTIINTQRFIMIYSFHFIIQFYYYLLSPPKLITVLYSRIQPGLTLYFHLSPNLALLFLHPLELCMSLAESRPPDAPAVSGCPCRAGWCRCGGRRPLHVREGLREVTHSCKAVALWQNSRRCRERWGEAQGLTCTFLPLRTWSTNSV